VRKGSEGEEGAQSEEGCGGRLPTASKFGTSWKVVLDISGRPFFLFLSPVPEKVLVIDIKYLVIP
jgi:hypothetical protein